MRQAIAGLLCALMLSASTVLAAPPPDPQAEKDVMAVMESWRRAMMSKDRAAFEKIYHPDLRYGHSGGYAENKTETIQRVITGKSVYAAVDLAETKVNVSGNLALVTGKVHYREVEDGKPSDVNMFVLHVLVKGSQGWQMIGRQSTREGSQ
ncbi:MAG: nuclear transport factor 2 family protein [Vicinamibacterales bacterium]|nr:nuclear transport factor 2 family protein [Vicinamibacterales bacterium]